MEGEERNDRFVLAVQMFGGFSMSANGRILNGEGLHSDMLLRLLAYTLCHRRKLLGVQELGDILWPDEGSDNPAGALKNLMYRLRTFLKKTWGDREYILTGRGSYQWNPEIEVQIDAEIFEEGCRRWEKEQNTKACMEEGKKLAGLYQGFFLPEMGGEYWVVAVSTYYHSCYLTLVKKLAVLLNEEKLYDQTENVCLASIQLDPLDEEVHRLYMQALMGDNKQNLALEHYQETVKLLYDNLGVRPSKPLQQIYEELLKQKHQQEADIHVIQKELRETKMGRGAFLCEYGVFRQMYVLESRSSERLGITVHLVLITLHPTLDIRKGSEAYRKLIGEGMEKLRQVLCCSLRSSDIVCRYSGNQFLVMLPACQYEDAVMVMGRTQRNYYEKNKKEKIQIQYSIDEICDQSVT